jgi:arylsulfatase A-like enzyme
VNQPNLLFIMSDDYAAQSTSAYGSVIDETPNLDRIATGGMRLNACFCTKSIYTPSRASILAGTYSHVNVDFAPAFLDLAGLAVPPEMQGRSLDPVLFDTEPDNWPESMYYRYWMHGDWAHNVPAHHGVRTKAHKLIGCHNDAPGQPGADGPVQSPEWELFDLVADPAEMRNVGTDPAYDAVARELQVEPRRLQTELGDEPNADAELERLLA